MKDEKEGPAAPVPPSAFRLPPLKVLVVDDNRDSADSMSLMLQMQGYDTHTAYDGQEALDAAEAYRPDVILLDIGLPKLSGYDVARRVRERPWGEKLLLVAVTGWGERRPTESSRRTPAGVRSSTAKMRR